MSMNGSDYLEGEYDPACKCGHRMHWHTSPSGPCVESRGCNCRSFIKHDFRLEVPQERGE